jgi:hypothetical protein
LETFYSKRFVSLQKGLRPLGQIHIVLKNILGCIIHRLLCYDLSNKMSLIVHIEGVQIKFISVRRWNSSGIIFKFTFVFIPIPPNWSLEYSLVKLLHNIILQLFRWTKNRISNSITKRLKRAEHELREISHLILLPQRKGHRVGTRTKIEGISRQGWHIQVNFIIPRLIVF